MAENSKIEWTDHTFNPWSGCTKVSPACDICYAETMSKRNPDVLGIWGKYGTRAIAAESYWKQPLKWNRDAEAAGERRRVFCASLADVFETQTSMPAEAWPAVRAARWRLLKLIRSTPHLDWLLLTKRPELVLPCVANAARIVGGDDTSQDADICWAADWIAGKAPQNVWIGTTVENQKYADERIPELLKIPAKVHFLSIEPLLGPIDLRAVRVSCGADAIGCSCTPIESKCDLHPTVDWVIVGGESGGKNARPMHPDWVRSLRDQCLSVCKDCRAEGAEYLRSTGPGFKDDVSHWATCERPAFHFKQWGNWAVYEPHAGGDLGGDMRRGVVQIVRPYREADGHYRPGDEWMRNVGKKNSGRLLDGREWNEVPEGSHA